MGKPATATPCRPFAPRFGDDERPVIKSGGRKPDEDEGIVPLAARKLVTSCEARIHKK